MRLNYLSNLFNKLWFTKAHNVNYSSFRQSLLLHSSFLKAHTSFIHLELFVHFKAETTPQERMNVDRWGN